jgi:hypothetical protein
MHWWYRGHPDDLLNSFDVPIHLINLPYRVSPRSEFLITVVTIRERVTEATEIGSN